MFFFKRRDCLAALNQYHKSGRDEATVNPGIIYFKRMKIPLREAVERKSFSPATIQWKQHFRGEDVRGGGIGGGGGGEGEMKEALVQKNHNITKTREAAKHSAAALAARTVLQVL